ncbi:hypothetical protein NMG60_11019287 [Bertholletia excelsa]
MFTKPGNSVSGAATDRVALDEYTYDKVPGGDDMTNKACDEPESFSDIDDIEVDGYLHNEEEKHLKKIIWEEMNREYIEEQAAKKSAAAAAKKAYEAKFSNCPEEMQPAQELAAAAAAPVAKSRKGRQQKGSAEARNSSPAQTDAEATRQILTKKRLSSKINYDALEKLFAESQEVPLNIRRSRVESHFDNVQDLANFGKKEVELKETLKDGQTGLEEEYEDTKQAYDSNLYYENLEEGYDYDDDYGYDGY